MNLTIDEGALADARDIANHLGISLSDYVTQALAEANLASAAAAAPTWHQQIASQRARFEGFAAAAQKELAETRTTGQAGHAA
ncbi:hypothetical protein Ppa06_57440 [Planomonospora parontospora subsp. parontospora]|uniref:Uncharacterized protein n=2 Tax=Planomonospora parontospora TaxID=58119 RepID=A0AA37BLW5_9ACTN|nr:hypothetical protein GCM10010126_57870 [Planomonospora parontospora]GII11946.1 hypothetical protein Ppa06_57440 [Planomonospora parontospora subsp. parontospora]